MGASTPKDQPDWTDTVNVGNVQVQTGQDYIGSQQVDIPAASSPSYVAGAVIQVVPTALVVSLGNVQLYLKSANGYSYNGVQIVPGVQWTDGTQAAYSTFSSAIAPGTMETYEVGKGLGFPALMNTLPLGGNNDVNPITVPGDTRPIAEQPLANWRRISPSLFSVLKIPILAGRNLTAADAGHHRVLVSAAAAHAAWGKRDPIGQTFRRGGENQPPYTVIGVVGDMHAVSLLSSGLVVYRWYGGNSQESLVLSTSLPAATIAPEIRRAIWNIDPSIPVERLRSMREIVAATLAPRRFQMLLVLLFAAAALLLVCLGIYGVVSYSVARRSPEIGLRMALGAGAPDLYRLVFVGGLRPVALGLLAGLAAALALGRALGSLLFGVSPFSPLLYAAAAVGLLLVAAAACWLPARRAVRIAPSLALRVE